MKTKSKEELISVIVPIYNVEDYLAECIDSLLAQTYSNYEIILIDDGSTDSSGRIADGYEKNNSIIKVFHQKNQGLSCARNKGIEKSKGEFLAFVDSDDVVKKNFLEKLYYALKNDNSDMSVCSIITFGNKLKKSQVILPNETISNELYYNRIIGNYFNWAYIVSWNKLYNREIFKDIRFPIGKIHEDEFVIHYIVSKCKKISVISEPLYLYRQRKNSITNNDKPFSAEKLHILEAWLDRYNFAKRNNIYQLAYVSGKKVLLCVDQYYIKAGKNKKCLKELNEISENSLWLVNDHEIWKDFGFIGKIKRKILLLHPKSCIILYKLKTILQRLHLYG